MKILTISLAPVQSSKEKKLRKKNNSKILSTVLRRTHFFETLFVYLMVFFIVALVIYRLENIFDSYGQSLWYCFELVTTVGFGDNVVITKAGRILSIGLSAYSIGMIAIITSTVVTYHQIKIKTQDNDILTMFMDKLERLPELDKEELIAMSERIKKLNRK